MKGYVTLTSTFYVGKWCNVLRLSNETVIEVC